jgi:hypothetical protein
LGSRQVPARIARQDRARRDVVLPLSDGVTAALQTYADRGVFRGFHADAVGRGRTAYEFQWLLGRPMRAVFDARRGVLTFDALFPGIAPASAPASGLAALVRERTSPRLPPHKRLDGRRARVSGATRRGDWSLTVTVRGRNHEYAVQRALNLINELFLFLHESHPEYLVRHFGLSPE